MLVALFFGLVIGVLGLVAMLIIFFVGGGLKIELLSGKLSFLFASKGNVQRK